MCLEKIVLNFQELAKFLGKFVVRTPVDLYSSDKIVFLAKNFNLVQDFGLFQESDVI